MAHTAASTYIPKGDTGIGLFTILKVILTLLFFLILALYLYNPIVDVQGYKDIISQSINKSMGPGVHVRLLGKITISLFPTILTIHDLEIEDSSTMENLAKIRKVKVEVSRAQLLRKLIRLNGPLDIFDADIYIGKILSRLINEDANISAQKEYNKNTDRHVSQPETNTAILSDQGHLDEASIPEDFRTPQNLDSPSKDELLINAEESQSQIGLQTIIACIQEMFNKLSNAGQKMRIYDTSMLLDANRIIAPTIYIEGNEVQADIKLSHSNPIHLTLNLKDNNKQRVLNLGIRGNDLKGTASIDTTLDSNWHLNGNISGSGLYSYMEPILGREICDNLRNYQTPQGKADNMATKKVVNSVENIQSPKATSSTKSDVKAHDTFAITTELSMQNSELTINKFSADLGKSRASIAHERDSQIISFDNVNVDVLKLVASCFSENEQFIIFKPNVRGQSSANILSGGHKFSPIIKLLKYFRSINLKKELVIKATTVSREEIVIRKKARTIGNMQSGNENIDGVLQSGFDPITDYSSPSDPFPHSRLMGTSGQSIDAGGQDPGGQNHVQAMPREGNKEIEGATYLWIESPNYHLTGELDGNALRLEMNTSDFTGLVNRCGGALPNLNYSKADLQVNASFLDRGIYIDQLKLYLDDASIEASGRITNLGGNTKIDVESRARRLRMSDFITSAQDIRSILKTTIESNLLGNFGAYFRDTYYGGVKLDNISINGSLQEDDIVLDNISIDGEVVSVDCGVIVKNGERDTLKVSGDIKLGHMILPSIASVWASLSDMPSPVTSVPEFGRGNKTGDKDAKIIKSAINNEYGPSSYLTTSLPSSVSNYVAGYIGELLFNMSPKLSISIASLGVGDMNGRSLSCRVDHSGDEILVHDIRSDIIGGEVMGRATISRKPLYSVSPGNIPISSYKAVDVSSSWLFKGCKTTDAISLIKNGKISSTAVDSSAGINNTESVGKGLGGKLSDSVKDIPPSSAFNMQLNLSSNGSSLQELMNNAQGKGNAVLANTPIYGFDILPVSQGISTAKTRPEMMALLSQVISRNSVTVFNRVNADINLQNQLIKFTANATKPGCSAVSKGIITMREGTLRSKTRFAFSVLTDPLSAPNPRTLPLDLLLEGSLIGGLDFRLDPDSILDAWFNSRNILFDSK